MTVITDVVGRQIFDSRGNPTVEVDVILSNGCLGRASVPSGASTGKYEALELRDNTDDFLGLGVSRAVNNINTEIFDILSGRSPFDQYLIDHDMIELDGTLNKSRLGANAILGVSLAVCKAAALASNTPVWKLIGGFNANYLPVPLMNIFNGGAHANNGLNIQEFMIMPVGFQRFQDALKSGFEIFHSLKKLLDNKGLSTTVGDEGGFAPEINDPIKVLNLISEAIEKAGYKLGEEIFFALDVAASEFYVNGKYHFSKNEKFLTTDELCDYWVNLVNSFPILSIEDPFSEDDIIGFVKLQKKIGKKVQIVGDDLFVTSVEKLLNGIKQNAGNSILIKLNQIGTLTETLETIKVAKKHNFNNIISHRSGETCDTFIADLSVGSNVGQIKAGSLSRSDRVSKYNQLIRIERQLDDNAFYCGDYILSKIIKGK